jgi:peptidoglycan hydrolase-like protein with peptidoglycan-binding domain
VSALPSALRRRSLPVLPIVLGLGGLVLAAAVWLLLSGGGNGGAPGRTGVTGGASTATLSRSTLVSRELVDGTLGYAGGRTVINRLGGSDAGASTPDQADGGSAASGSLTVTALPRPGSVVSRGGALYRLDSKPVVLMYGSTPAYRDLEQGVEDGRDIRQLEANLSALGFDPGIIDETFTSSTAGAVSDWQESQGLEETGRVELGRVAFLPGPRRVGERKVAVGSLIGAGAEVLVTSSTRRVVTVELDASLQNIARKGDRVEITLPAGRTVAGRISDAGRVAREQESDSGAAAAGAAEEEAELVIDVTIELRSKRGLGRFDEAPVSVGLAQESRRGVLAAPVDALLARRGGGYGVELAGSGRIVPVETGMFADGLVEISGRGIGPGTRVVVPGE